MAWYDAIDYVPGASNVKGIIQGNKWQALTGAGGKILGDPKAPYDELAKTIQGAADQTKQFSELQWQRQMEGLNRALGATSNYRNTYDKIYGTNSARPQQVQTASPMPQTQRPLGPTVGQQLGQSVGQSLGQNVGQWVNGPPVGQQLGQQVGQSLEQKIGPWTNGKSAGIDYLTRVAAPGGQPMGYGPPPMAYQPPPMGYNPGPLAGRK